MAPLAAARTAFKTQNSELKIRPPLLLAGVLAISLAVRLVGLGWGMPDYTPGLMPHTDYRTSYHIDEDNFLWGLMQMRPATGDFEVKDYHWGTLQFYAIFGALELGEWTGLVPTPWQAAFQRGDVAALPRLYLLGRLVSVAAGLAATLIVAALAAALAGGAAGLVAGLAYALAPLAVVEAHYLTNDVTMSALVAGAVLAAVGAVQRGRGRRLLAAGLLLGLATAAKYSAGFAAPALLVAQWALWRGSHAAPAGKGLLRAVLQVAGPWLAAAAGFLLAEPYALISPQSVLQGLRETAAANAPDLGAGIAAPLGMLRWDALNLAAYGLTWPLALLAAGGLAVLLARLVEYKRARGRLDGVRMAQGAILLTALAGLGAGLLLNRVFVLRYTQPLVPLLAVSAGIGWAAIPRSAGRALAGSVALAGAGVITGGQLALLSGPHPANALLAWLNGHVPSGGQVAFAWPEYTLLDQDRYALLRLDPWRAVLPTGAHPDYIVMDDMQLGPPAATLVQVLARDYQPVARFAARPQLGPFAWDEGVTPHDWKYSHPTFVVYARR